MHKKIFYVILSLMTVVSFAQKLDANKDKDQVLATNEKHLSPKTTEGIKTLPQKRKRQDEDKENLSPSDNIILSSPAKKLRKQASTFPMETPSFPYQFSPNAYWQTCFTPIQKCTDFITNNIDKAENTIQLQAYIFTSKPIADALIAAKQRGVEVRVIVDHSQVDSSSSKIAYLSQNQVPVYVDQNATIAHNKIIIIDAETVITGSFNFSAAADKRNAENIILIHDPVVAGTYLQNWLVRYELTPLYESSTPTLVELKPSPTRPKSMASIRSTIKPKKLFLEGF